MHLKTSLFTHGVFQSIKTVIIICNEKETHSNLAPDTMKARKTLVTLDGFVTLITLAWTVSLNPEMMHDLFKKAFCLKKRSMSFD